MRKRIAFVFLILLIIGSIVSAAYAHDDQSEHDKDLKYALFGSRDKVLSGEAKDVFQAISDAAAVSIDQFSPNTTSRWKEGTYNELQDELETLNLPKISTEFDDLDLNSKVTKNGKNVTANTHRKYTHMGWNYKYYPNEEFWEKRKNVLLHVVNWTLFNDSATFKGVPWARDLLYAPSEQCEAFCAVVYYIHILGDHIEGNTPDKLTDLEPLIQYTSLSTPGIIAELKEQLQIVFASQTGGWTYAKLMEELSNLEHEAEQNCGMWGSIDTEEKCKKNQEYAKELLKILSDNLPTLLEKEDFFKDCFG